MFSISVTSDEWPTSSVAEMYYVDNFIGYRWLFGGSNFRLRATIFLAQHSLLMAAENVFKVETTSADVVRSVPAAPVSEFHCNFRLVLCWVLSAIVRINVWPVVQMFASREKNRY